MKRDRCKTCTHNTAKDDPDRHYFDCELYCYGTTRTKTDDDGMVYVTACEDYMKERK